MAYLLPIGPWHPALDEPVVFKLEVSGTKVDRVEIELGFNHRGLEKTLEREVLPHQQIALASHICGKCSYANTLAVATALEKLAGVTPPLRVCYLRTLTAELERAASHLTSVAKTLRLLGINLLAARLEEETEGVRQLLAATGNRVYDTFNILGGAIRGPQLPLEFLSAVERLRKNVYESVNQLLDSRQIERRTVGGGIITYQEAIVWSLVGPIARASDVSIDLRRDDPYAAYEELDVRVITQRGGHLFARLAVRLLESLEAMNIAAQALKNMPGGSLADEMLPPVFPANTETCALVESPRGVLFCYAASDETGKLARLKLRPPTVVNLPALPIALTGQEVDDAAALIASLDYCFACGER